MPVKIIPLNDDTFLGDGERLTIIPFTFSKSASVFEVDDRYKGVSKTAACNEAQSFATTISPQPGKRVLLVSAMGSYEAWGPNKKADAFPLAGLLNKSPERVSPEVFTKYASSIPKKFGHLCFPTVFDSNGNQIGGGNTFLEHENRVTRTYTGEYPDPRGPKTAADPRCGNILASFWNPKMNRVELIQEVWEHRLPRMVQMIDEGFLPGISMACDIPFDRCSICNNLAPTEYDYCEHLAKGLGMRGHMSPEGILIVMLNDFPVLFDSSLVDSPACYTGKTLEKIASFYIPFSAKEKKDLFSTEISNPKEKTASIESILIPPKSEPQIIRIQILRMGEPSFGDKISGELAKIPFSRLLTYLGLLGIHPTGPDMAKILLGKKGDEAENIGSKVEEALLPALLHRIYPTYSSSFLPFLKRKRIIKVASDSDFIQSEFKQVSSLVEPYLPLKSYHKEYLKNRISLGISSEDSRVKEAGFIALAKRYWNSGGGNSRSSQMINLNSPFSSLSPETKDLLLARVLMDEGLVKKLRDILINPDVQEELEKRGINHKDWDPSDHPYYEDNHGSSYIGLLDKARIKQFLSN